MNDYSNLSTESDVSFLAQTETVESSEMNAYLDELQMRADEIEDIRPLSPEGLALNSASWSILESIHAEIAPTIDAMRQREELIESLV